MVEKKRDRNKERERRQQQQVARQSKAGGNPAAAAPPTPGVGGKDPRHFGKPQPAQLPANDPSVTSRLPVITPGPHSLGQIVRGCKVWVDRPGEPEPRKAEILSIRERPRGRGARASATPAPADDADDGPLTEYYLHYVLFNKRLDEWVPGTRLLVKREIEWPVAPTPSAATGAATPQPPSKMPSFSSGATTPSAGLSFDGFVPPAPTTNSLLRKAATRAAKTKNNKRPRSMSIDEDASMLDEDGMDIDEDVDRDADGDEDAEGEDEDAEGEDDFEAALTGQDQKAPQTFSKAEEIENLRHHGSMTQSVHEIARVKNLDKITMGKHVVEAWYYSAYPVEYAHIPMLYICEFCLCFYGSEKQMERHRSKCTLVHPPGNEIYRHDDISFFEIDGRKQKVWCRNLCLLSKCFLDHKTLYYDVDPFLFYVMTKRDSAGCHMTGYFSKEKESAEQYNLACILTLPQYQNRGYGRLLIEFSYELSKKEGKLGSPEKPLSDLGLISYRAYWSEIIVEELLKAREDGEVTVDAIASKTSMLHSDIVSTCQLLDVLKVYKGQYVFSLSTRLQEMHEAKKAKPRTHIEAESLHWRPIVFTRDQLRYGW